MKKVNLNNATADDTEFVSSSLL